MTQREKIEYIYELQETEQIPQKTHSKVINMKINKYEE